jgi:hypothetical protein
MAISSYPRTIVNGTSDSSNNNSGVGLMLWDVATQSYIAATPSTFSGGGGGGGGNIYDSVGSPILCDDPTNGILKVAVHNSGGGNVAVSTSTLQNTLNTLVTDTNILLTALNSNVSTSGGQATLNGLVSTSALQTSLNSLISTLNALTITSTNNNSASTNGGVLIDSFGSVTLTTSYVALSSITCKYVTLVNLSTNAKLTYNILNSGANLTLEAGYSVRVNCSNASRIYVAQTTGEGNTLQYIITA